MDNATANTPKDDSKLSITRYQKQAIEYIQDDSLLIWHIRKSCVREKVF